MIDLEYLKKNVEEYKENLRNRQLDVAHFHLDKILHLYEEKKRLTTEIQELERQRNLLTGKVEEIEKAKDLKAKLQAAQTMLRATQRELFTLSSALPNRVSAQMPIGKSSQDNKVIKEWGEKKSFSFPIKDHLELGKDLDLIDIENSAKTSGSRFYFLKNDLVFLQWALFTFVLRKLSQKGFIPIIPPVIVKEQPLFGTGYFPGEKDQVYEVKGSLEEKESKYLVGTSEVPLVGLEANRLFQKNELPKKYAGYSNCFRSEAGSWGKDVKGIKRVHQFDKIEMIYFTTQETSQEYMEEARSIEEEILQELGLPYRILEMCTGDIGFATYRKWDIEVWLPTSNNYMEVMSNSDLWDYQARRLDIRYRQEPKGKSEYVHTISATGITNTRPLLAIMENFQQADGSILIPKVLQEFMGKEIITKQ